MTAHAHRAPFHPFDREARQRRRLDRSAASAGADHAPQVLLAVSAVLVVLAGPVARAVAPHNGWVGALSVLLLVAGILLAVAAVRHLLRVLSD